MANSTLGERLVGRPINAVTGRTGRAVTTQRRYSRATRMAATFLAKQSGAEAAATAFGIDPRTVRSWMATVEIPDDQWTAIRDVLLARGAEMAATGKGSGLPGILTGAGIAERNVRYATLIARREARRAEEEQQPEQPPPLLDGVPDARRRWIRDYFDAHIALRRYRGPSDEWPILDDDTDLSDEDRDRLREWIGRVAAADQAELDADMEAIRADVREAVAGYVVSRRREFNQWFYRVTAPDGTTILDGSNRLPWEFEHLSVLDDGPPPAATDVTPPLRVEMAPQPSEPAQPAPRAPEGLVVDLDDTGWETWTRVSY